MMTIATRVLPADVYDTLEIVAEAYGGVGCGLYFEWSDADVPCCIHGCAKFAEDAWSGPVSLALEGVGIYESENDRAFIPGERRIPFSEWCKRLNVVRGE